MRVLMVSLLCFGALACSSSSRRSSLLADEDASQDVVGAVFDDDIVSLADVDELPDSGGDSTDGMTSDLGMVDGVDATTAAPDTSPDTSPDTMDADVAPDVADTGQPPVGEISGGILVVQVETSEVKVGTVAVGFQEGLPVAETPIASEGACDVFPFSGGAGPAASAGLDAGTVTLAGLKTPMALAPVDSGAAGWTYDSGLPDDNESILSVAPTVTVSGSGGSQVPAFAGTVGVPAPVTVFSPTNDAQKDQPLTVSWNPAGAAATRIDLFVYDGEKMEQMKGNVISCNFDGDSGTAVVPAALMKMLPGGGSGPFNLDFLIVGVSRIEVAEVPLADGDGGTLGTVTIAVTRSGGGGVPFED
ncbi:MAG: hypothetical protein ACI9OJ_002406 [Myxococcota bacterium]|jgi:hypothetical protein